MAIVNNTNIRKTIAQLTGWAAGEALTKVTKVIAGDGYKTMRCARYLDKRATGSVFEGFDLDAAFAAVEAKKAEKETAAPTPQTASRKENHSPAVVLNKDGYWEPKEAATDCHEPQSPYADLNGAADLASVRANNAMREYHIIQQKTRSCWEQRPGT